MKSKKTTKLNKVYMVKDAVTNEEVMLYMGKNEKEVVRSMVFSGFFNVTRVMDTILIDTGYIIDNGVITNGEKSTLIDLLKTLKELSIQVENKATKIDLSVTETEKALIKGDIDKLEEHEVESKA